MKFDTYTLREHSIKIPTPQTFSDVVELVSSDYYRICERELHFGGDCPKTHKLESVNFQFATDDSTFSQLRSCFDFVCRIKQQNHDTTVSD